MSRGDESIPPAPCSPRGLGKGTHHGPDQRDAGGRRRGGITGELSFFFKETAARVV